MPFRSEKQRRFLWAKRPDIAERWAKEYGGIPITSDRPTPNNPEPKPRARRPRSKKV